MKKIRKAIIPAAGLGTRFLPATKAMPKEMLPIVDKPTIQYIVEEAVASGIEDIIIVTGKGKRAIEDHFDASPELERNLEEKGKLDLLARVQYSSNLADIHYIRQKEPKGLGHAVWCARNFIGDEPFAVLLGDDLVDSDVPCLSQMIGVYDKHQHNLLAVQKVETENLKKYGVIGYDRTFDNVYAVNRVVEKPRETPPSDLAVIGKYILEPSIFDLLDKTIPDERGEIQLADALNEIALQGKLHAYEYIGRRYDVGDKIGFLKANLEFALQREEMNTEFFDYLKNLMNKNIIKS
ncbi:UTP--glucose-1-phosphate uridylyltransferase GalU [Radiobacillus kanasensis]|uniref:UTP--glucose-1-phosphate uridylyltransferase GalU n=1 Tax=Radiobacillus kanasensis TaxID=2844358 RepID=UPI001E300517|nr:UTP--glucose-1-phosphate uridylyltransferase GalU [Radiobacillus kanasensis]UFT98856.1 UTP--glucose-1-phosphate uridylyltransferase GalU [Radiobacillus kanasensis]